MSRTAVKARQQRGSGDKISMGIESCNTSYPAPDITQILAVVVGGPAR